MYPHNHKMGQTVQTDVGGVVCDRGFIAHYQVTAAAADPDGVLAATALTAQTAEVSTGITSPDVPRNLTVVGNAAGIAGNVVITGTNFAGEEITETFALNGDTPVVGTKAFKKVTRISLPAETHAGTDTVSVGWGDKLGLPYKLPHNTVLASCLGNGRQANPPTVTTNPAALESNTVELDSPLDGQVVDIYLIV
ncbi:MAG: hypothetical protein ACOY93_13530 [Bacillota bacterium]